MSTDIFIAEESEREEDRWLAGDYERELDIIERQQEQIDREIEKAELKMQEVERWITWERQAI